MLNEQQKAKISELLSLNEYDQTIRDNIELCIENGVSAAKNNELDLLTDNLDQCCRLLGTNLLDKNDQKKLIENLAIVVKSSVSKETGKILKEQFRWSKFEPLYHKPKEKKIKKEMWKWEK